MMKPSFVFPTDVWIQVRRQYLIFGKTARTDREGAPDALDDWGFRRALRDLARSPGRRSSPSASLPLSHGPRIL